MPQTTHFCEKIQKSLGGNGLLRQNSLLHKEMTPDPKDLANSRNLALDKSIDILVASAEYVEDFLCS